MTESPDLPPEIPTDRGLAEARRLRTSAYLVVVGLVVVSLAAITGAVSLLDTPETSDIQELAIIAGLSGLAGGAMFGALGIVQTAADGVVLSDGVVVPTARSKQVARTRQRDANDAVRGLSRDDIAEALIAPVLGAVLGVVVCAGVVGGFLVATTGSEASFSSSAMLFLAFLSGFFSRTVLNRLSGAAEVLFGSPTAGGNRDTSQQTRD